MNEGLLHYIWKFQLLEHATLKTDSGETVEVVHPGLHNNDAGPDFFNSKVRIGNTVWAGNVEIHVRSSDWNRHDHSSDDAYNNVILHVVYEHDSEIYDKNKRMLPTMQIGDKFLSDVQNKYSKLMENRAWVPCAPSFSSVAEDKFYIDSYLERLLISRMERKSSAVFNSLKSTNNNLEESFYWSLARSFGFKTNAEPFELLARSIPLKIINKHRQNIFQLEALLFGQAGFLQNGGNDEYASQLAREYYVFCRRYELSPNGKHLWKFLRLRPGNFPTLRIAQFAHLLSISQNLFQVIRELKSLVELKELLQVNASSYWDCHYNFKGSRSKSIQKRLGTSSIDSVLINTVAPFLFVYGHINGLQEYKDRSLELLCSLPPENNSVINNWKKLGYVATSAFFSQALIELKTEYCQKKKCLSCGIGNRILRN